MSGWFGLGSSSSKKEEEEIVSIDVTSRREFIAGSSFKHVDDVVQNESSGSIKSDKTSNDDSHTWKYMDASEFSLRVGPNYKRTGAKAPSGPSLYELVGLDVIQTALRIDDIGNKLNFPEEWSNIQSNHDKVPAIFIVNAQLPSSFETSLFTDITDGDGWSLVHYFRIRPEIAAEYAAGIETASPAAKLFAKYCEDAPNNQSDSYSTWYGRFKLILRCENIEEFGLPSFITGYNAKPVLIRNTGTLLSKKESSIYQEIDINVHRFGSVPKKGLGMLMGKFKEMDISTAFCIESRDDDEMPEVILGCARIHKPDYTKAPHWGELAVQSANST